MSGLGSQRSGGRGRRLHAGVVAALMLVASPAAGQDRSPTQRQALIDLAGVLGQSHALRQVCEGAADQTWRSWMSRLIEAEAPDAALDRRLREAFNTAYYAAQARFTACDAGSRAEAARLAARGRALSRAARSS